MGRSGRSGAVWFRGSRRLRSRWPSWLGVALLVGVAGGFVVGAAAGARRTTSAYDRLLESARPFDAILGVGCADESAPAECPAAASIAIEQLIALPIVADSARAAAFLVPVLKDDGFSIQPQEESLAGSGEPPGETCFTGSGEVNVVGSPDGRLGTEINRHRFVAGRAADPSRPDEAVLSVATARRAGIEVGDSLRIVPVDACEGLEPEEWPEPFEVTIVGLHVAPGEVQPETGRYFQSLTVTPPLLADLTAALGEAGEQQSVMLRLRAGATTGQLMQAVDAAGIPAQLVIAQDEFTRDVRRGLRPDALTLWLLAALGAGASAIVLSQALVRQACASAHELPALRALGFTSRDLVRVGAIEGAAVAVVSAVVSAVVVVAGSPLFPIGRARVAEPDPGLRVDLLAIGIGALVVAVGSLVAVVLAARHVAARTSKPRPSRVHASRISGVLAGIGVRPPVVVGVHIGLGVRGHSARAVPVRSGLLGATVGLAALVGSVIFGASLDHLLDSPRLVGWNWDVAFFGAIEPADPDVDPIVHAEELLAGARSIDGVERVGYLTLFPTSYVPILEELPDVWAMSFSTGPRSIKPTVTSGRAPAGPDELLVTKKVLADLGVRVGDTVEVHGAGETETGDIQPTTATVTIVGTGVFPVGDGQFERIVALTFDGMRRLTPATQPQFGMVDIAAGADGPGTAAALDALDELGLRDPIPSEGLNVTALVDLDLSRADDLPRLLGALMAVLAVGVLAHLVVTGVRSRRHELAILRALGFTAGQVRTTLAVQATVVAIVPYTVATVIGAVAGRAVWLAYAERLGVAPEAVVAWRPIVGFLIPFLVIAHVVAATAGYGVRRHRVSEALRAE